MNVTISKDSQVIIISPETSFEVDMIRQLFHLPKLVDDDYQPSEYIAEFEDYGDGGHVILKTKRRIQEEKEAR